MFPGAWSAGARIRVPPSGCTERCPSGDARDPESAPEREAPGRPSDTADCAGLGEDGGGGGGGSSQSRTPSVAAMVACGDAAVSRRFIHTLFWCSLPSVCPQTAHRSFVAVLHNRHR